MWIKMSGKIIWATTGNVCQVPRNNEQESYVMRLIAVYNLGVYAGVWELPEETGLDKCYRQTLFDSRWLNISEKA